MLGDIYQEKMGAISVEPSLQNLIVMESPSFLSGNSKQVDFHVDHCATADPIFQGRNMTSEGRDSADIGISEDSALVQEQASDIGEFVEVAMVMQNASVKLSFQGGHCKTLEHDGSNVLTEVVADDVDSSSSLRENAQLEEDGEDDEMLGGIFAFSEEGKI